MAPHKVEGWTEWWVPVAGTNGLTTLSRDVALNLEVTTRDSGSDIQLRLAATRVVPGARLAVGSVAGKLLDTTADLDPAKPFQTHVQIEGGTDKLRELVVTVTDSKGNLLLDYHRPDSEPGRKEYTPFTKPLESPRKSPDEMSVEELTLAAEFKLKELDAAGAAALLEKALQKDPGFSRAHLLLGIRDFNAGHFSAALPHLQKTIERDPYCDTAYYYLAMDQFALGDRTGAERNLYYIWPDSAYFGAREYHLGRLALLDHTYPRAIEHLKRAISVNASDLLSRFALALAYRESADKTMALEQIRALEQIDPTSRTAEAERYLLTGDANAKAELTRLLGGQSQEAIGVSIFYRNLERWNDAVRVLRLVEETNHDPWGTPPEFYYTLAYCQRRSGAQDLAAEAMKHAQESARNIDRFPYRPESEAPFAEAVERAPDDEVARFGLACLLYYQGRTRDAVAQWEAAVRLNPADFSARRALGLAYAEQGSGLEKAAAELERAVELRPAHVRTLNDLSNLYARAGDFDQQLAVLSKALQRSPKDDDLAESVLTADLMKGRYEDAEHLIATREFAPRHRTYSLRDKYRLMKYALGAQAFNRGDYQRALDLFRSSLTPPVSLGVDDFQFQSTPRVQYYVGRTLEALGQNAEAKQAYMKSTEGIEHLSGDRDSWSSENFFMILSLERLGRADEAARLRVQFENFAKSETDTAVAQRRAEARYLRGLIAKRDGNPEESMNWMRQALDAQPDLLTARMELRGDVLDPLQKKQ